MSEIGHYMKAAGRLAREVDQLKQILAACAYWAASGLHPISEDEVKIIILENILKETKEFAESEPGCDNNIVFEGFEYTYTPVGGWPEPEKEQMDDSEGEY